MRVYMHLSVHYPDWLTPLQDDDGETYVELESFETLQRFLKHFDYGYLYWAGSQFMGQRFVFIEQYEG